MPGMLVMACPGVTGAMPAVPVVSRLTRSHHRGTRMRVPGVHVSTLSHSAVRLGGSAKFMARTSRMRRPFAHVVVMRRTLRVMSLRVMISWHVAPLS
jgi:hypothetical protein